MYKLTEAKIWQAKIVILMLARTIFTYIQAKNQEYWIDDTNCLKPVSGKYVLSQSELKVDNSSKISHSEGVIHWEEGEGGALDYVRIEN